MTTPAVERPSPNFDNRHSAVSFLIFHYTAMSTAEEALQRLCDPAAKVSAHYLVDEGGVVYRLVPEDKSAWHAGLSYWGGLRNLNGSSVGIEIANPGDRPFPAAQMGAVTELSRAILTRHRIPAHHVLGHSDIAPDRKIDPGPRFNWSALATSGVGLWPTPTGEDYETSAIWRQREVRQALTAYGYSPELDYTKVVTSFQLHFRQELFNSVQGAPGQVDAETKARLSWLVRHKAGNF
jgi:N-acetylmuramoyl-L-alanine amidase